MSLDHRSFTESASKALLMIGPLSHHCPSILLGRNSLFVEGPASSFPLKSVRSVCFCCHRFIIAIDDVLHM